MKRFDFVRLLMMLVMLGASASAFAVGNPQVYDVRFVLRTTVAQSDTLSFKDNPFLWEEDEKVVYREPRTVNWHGLIWGVGSNAINGLWEATMDAQEQERIGGCVMWDAATKQVTYLANGSDLSDVASVPGCNFGWDFFNAIGQNGRLCEGCWTMEQCGLACEESFELFRFVGSGFGTLTFSAQREEGYIDITDASHVDSISGDLTGYMRAPSMIIGDGCSLCGGEVSCEFAAAWSYCDCDDYLDDNRTATHGTWVVKYNPLYSYQYGKVTSIRETDCFADLPLVAAQIEAIENCILGIDPTGCDKLEHALALAKQNTYAAEQALDAVSYENLKAAEAAAQAALAKAEYARYESETNYAAKVVAWDNATYALEIAQASTKKDWTITWKNSSQDIVTSEGVGTDAMLAKFAELKGYTIIEATYGNTIFINAVEQNASATCTALNKAVETAEKNLVTATANKAAAEAALKAANAEVVKANDAVTAAENNLANIDLLQYKAEQELEKAQAAEALAQKAYDDNYCGGGSYDDPSDCDELAHALALAKQNTYAKEQALDAVSYENLKKAIADAEVALGKAQVAKNVAQTNYDAKVVAWQNATNALAIARAATNQSWTITWVNSSQDIVIDDGVGTDSMIAKFTWLGGKYTINEATYGRIIYTKDVEKNATATCTALNKAVETAEQNLVTATVAKAAAEAALKAAKAEVVEKEDAVTAAKNDLANINLLQYKAENELEKAQAAEAAAQKAYDDNRCGE